MIVVVVVIIVVAVVIVVRGETQARVTLPKK